MREEEKITPLKLRLIFLRHIIRNVNILLKKEFKNAERLTKTPFSFTLETVLKMAKEAKETPKLYVQEQTNAHQKGWKKLKLI